MVSQNKYFTRESGAFQEYFTDHPASTGQEIKDLSIQNLTENLGEKAHDDPRNMASIGLLGSLGSHDLSAMRDVIGMPQKCLAATRTEDNDGRSVWWNAIFRYEGFKAYFEVSSGEYGDDADPDLDGD